MRQTLELQVRFARPSSTQGRLKYAVFSAPLCKGSWRSQRLRGCPFGARYGLFSHRNVFSKHPGVPHGLFYDQAILWLDLQNAHAPGSLRSPSDAAPNQLFELLRCSGRLIFRFRTDPSSVRRCSARLIRQAETLELQPRSRPPSSHTMAFAPKRSTFSRFAACEREPRATSQSAAAVSSPYAGEPRATPQSAAAASSPYILRTDSALRAAPVLRSAYFPKRVHRTLFSKTLDLQPLCGLRRGSQGRDNPSVRCGGQLPLHASVASGLRRGEPKEGTTPQSAAADSSPYAGEPKEGTTPQSAAADSSPYILRTDSALRAAPVLRSAYFPKRVHRTLFSKTLDLQPLCGLRRGSQGRDNPSVRCGGQLPLHASVASGLRRGEPKEGTTPQSAAADSSPYAGEPKEGTTPQSAAADSSPYTGEPRKGQPLSLLRRTAPLTQGSRGRDNLSV